MALIDGGLADDAQLQEALVRLRNHPVADEAYQEAKRWADDAVASIATLPAGSVKSALELFAQAVVDRTN